MLYHWETSSWPSNTQGKKKAQFPPFCKKASLQTLSASCGNAGALSQSTALEQLSVRASPLHRGDAHWHSSCSGSPGAPSPGAVQVQHADGKSEPRAAKSLQHGALQHLYRPAVAQHSLLRPWQTTATSVPSKPMHCSHVSGDKPHALLPAGTSQADGHARMPRGFCSQSLQNWLRDKTRFDLLCLKKAETTSSDRLTKLQLVHSGAKDAFSARVTSTPSKRRERVE